MLPQNRKLKSRKFKNVFFFKFFFQNLEIFYQTDENRFSASLFFFRQLSPRKILERTTCDLTFMHFHIIY